MKRRPAVPVLAAVDADGVLREWATNDGDSQLVHKVTRGAISSARWSPDGKSIAVGAFPDNIVDVTNDAGTDTIPLDAPVLGVYDCQWSPKGASRLSARQSRMAWLRRSARRRHRPNASTSLP